MDKIREFFPLQIPTTNKCNPDLPVSDWRWTKQFKKKALFISRKAQRPHTHLFPMKFLPICHHNSMSLSIISHNKIKFLERDYPILQFKKGLGNKYNHKNCCFFFVCKLWPYPQS